MKHLIYPISLNISNNTKATNDIAISRRLALKREWFYEYQIVETSTYLPPTTHSVCIYTSVPTYVLVHRQNTNIDLRVGLSVIDPKTISRKHNSTPWLNTLVTLSHFLKYIENEVKWLCVCIGRIYCMKGYHCYRCRIAIHYHPISTLCTIAYICIYTYAERLRLRLRMNFIFEQVILFSQWFSTSHRITFSVFLSLCCEKIYTSLLLI